VPRGRDEADDLNPLSLELVLFLTFVDPRPRWPRWWVVCKVSRHLTTKQWLRLSVISVMTMHMAWWNVSLVLSQYPIIMMVADRRPTAAARVFCWLNSFRFGRSACSSEECDWLAGLLAANAAREHPVFLPCGISQRPAHDAVEMVLGTRWLGGEIALTGTHPLRCFSPITKASPLGPCRAFQLLVGPLGF
jgi:hypothetical protein